MQIQTLKKMKKLIEKYNEIGSYADKSLIDGTPMEARSKGIQILKNELADIAISLITNKQIK